MRLALDHPELVNALLLVASIGGAGAVTFGDAVLAAPLVGPALSLMTLAGLAKTMPVVVRLTRSKSLKANLPDEVTRLSAVEVQSFVDDQRFLMRDHVRLQHAAHRITVPTYVLHGDLDVVVPLGAARALAHELGVDCDVIEGVGHLVLSQAPDRVAEAILALIDQPA